MHRMYRALSVVALLALAGCGGGGDSGGGTTNPPNNTPPGPSITYTAGVFPASSTFAEQCTTPRTGNDPATNLPYPDRAGSALAEKHFLRSWSNELYLWYDEI